jgi:alkylation response protein AidB-like acyl-CoA dehydrogenase
MKISKDHLLGKEGGGFETMRKVYATNGVATGAQAVGLATAAYNAALEYAKERVIWGEPIGKYQSIGNMLVDMNAEIEMSRLLVHKVAWQSENDTDEALVPANMAKVFPAEMARRVCVNALQIFGAMGVMKECTTEKLVRDSMILPIISGGNEMLKHFISLELLR